MLYIAQFGAGRIGAHLAAAGARLRRVVDVNQEAAAVLARRKLI